MKTKLIILAALSSGLTILPAQNTPVPPPPPGEGGNPSAPGGPPQGAFDPKARFEEAFKKIDSNGDGKVTKEEFIEFSKKEAEERFVKMDASGSGSLTKEQLFESMRRQRGGETGQRRPEGFRRPEGEGGGARPRPGADGGQPSGEQGGQPGGGFGGQQGGRGGFGGGMGGGMVELFRKIQETGSVSKEDFTKMSEEQFKRLDSNGDGKVTREELEELGRKMREARGGQQGGSPDGGAPQGGGQGGFRRPPSAASGGGGGNIPKRPEVN